MSYFSQPKNERDKKSLNGAAGEPKLDAATTSAKSLPEMVSTLGPGMLITGNITCAGSVQIFGRVIGDIHASHLVICEGAQVEGKVIAPETVIDGVFKGIIHGNSVKLQSTAVVDGEIFNRSLTIELNAQFEGVSRKLDKPIEPPSRTQISGEKPAQVFPAPSTLRADEAPALSDPH